MLSLIFRYEFAENLAIRARHRRHLRPRLEHHHRHRRRPLSRLLLHPHLLHLRPHPLCHRHHRHHHLDDAEIC